MDNTAGGLGKAGIGPLWLRLPPAVVRNRRRHHSDIRCHVSPFGSQPSANRMVVLDLQPIDRSAGPPARQLGLPLRIHAPSWPRHLCRASRAYRYACSPGFARWCARQRLVLGRAGWHDGLSPSRSWVAECALPARGLLRLGSPAHVSPAPPAACGASATCGCKCHVWGGVFAASVSGGWVGLGVEVVDCEGGRVGWDWV